MPRDRSSSSPWQHTGTGPCVARRRHVFVNRTSAECLRRIRAGRQSLIDSPYDSGSILRPGKSARAVAMPRGLVPVRRAGQIRKRLGGACRDYGRRGRQPGLAERGGGVGRPQHAVGRQREVANAGASARWRTTVGRLRHSEWAAARSDGPCPRPAGETSTTSRSLRMEESSRGKNP